MTAFLGMRGTGDWATNQRPENWRQSILFLDPNGSAPLTAISSMLASESTDDPKYHWWTKTLPTQGGSLTNVFTDPNLATAYVSGATSGDVLYIQLAEALADEFREGHQVKIGKSQDYRYDTRGKVLGVAKNGASSFLTVKLTEDADATYDLDEADVVHIIGNMNPQGGTMPDAVSYDPVQHTNVTSILRTPLSITRTARKTRLRTGDAYQELKREALQLHSIEIEKHLLWSSFYEGIGANGKPETTTRGLIPAIIENEPNNVFSYHTDTDYSGKTWLMAGEDWLDNSLEVLFRYGSTDKMAFAGSGALLGINRLAKTNGQIQLIGEVVSYGIKVMRWDLPFGTLFIKTHPLFSFTAVNRYDMVVFEPQKLRLRILDDTDFYSDPQDQKNRNNRKDGTDEEWLTELGLEYHHTPAFGFLNGVGLDNTV